MIFMHKFQESFTTSILNVMAYSLGGEGSFILAGSDSFRDPYVASRVWC